MDACVKLDWLSFTYHAPLLTLDGEEQAPVLISFKRMFPELEDVWQFMEIGGTNCHYNMSLKAGSDFLCRYNDKSDLNGIGKDMGLNFEVPSHSLPLFFKLFNIDISSSDAVPKMMKLLLDRGCLCSRIDICFDDYSKTFRAYDFQNWWMHNCFNTHFRNARFESSGQGRDAGNTFYLGSRKANKLLRIYDKDIQSEGELDCIRYEFEYHSKWAQTLQKHLICAKLNLGSLISDWFIIVDPIYPNDKNKCPIVPEWKEFLDKFVFCEQLSDITVPFLSKNQYRMSRIEYVEKYVSGVIKEFVFLSSWEHLHDVVNSAHFTQRYESEQNSIKLRSMVDDPYFVPIDKLGFRKCLDFDNPFAKV